ncbi:MAG TPA: alginate lyase family protein, partial [Polyangiales bacterium]|nr:alginate lyase family protein [Polyangiales bacterium]
SRSGRMKLARAVRMRPADLADRLRQEQLKVLERLKLVPAGDPRLDALPLDRFRALVRDRFFAGAVHDGIADLIAARMPDARERVLAAAEQSLAGRFDLLGYRGLDFGEPINWQLDPLAGTTAPLEHWTRIDPLDRAAVGDHKVVWELNRQQWLLHWAQAYAFTHDERYAERSIELLERWLRANPVGIGINWVSSLELAMRLMSWCWTLVLLRDSPALRPETFTRLLGAVHAHAKHIARYLSTTYSPNTHLLGEALGLFYAGVLFPELDRGAEWRTTGERILVEQLDRQVLPDGVYFEQSTCYQRYTIEMYLHFLILAGRNGRALPAEVSSRVESCVEFLMAVRRGDGSAPQIGDGDGGWLLPLVPRAADDMRGVFGLAAAFFGRLEYSEAAGGDSFEAAWLLGPEALRPTPATEVRSAPTTASRLFEDGGYAVLRSEPGPRAHTLILDVGPLGCPFSAAHGHADLLALTCDVFGAPCIVDPGMPTYGGDPKWRDAFRSTAMHSSVVVDGLSQAEPAGTFSWSTQPRARLRSWISNDGFDFADAAHDAYALRCNGLVHRRRVLFVKPRYWVVVDDLEGDGSGAMRAIELGFQFALNHRLTIEQPWVRATAPHGHALLVRTTVADSRELAPTIHEGELSHAPTRGWVSSAYGRAEAAPALRYRTRSTLPLRAVTYLLPLERADMAAPAIFPEEPDASLLRRLLS